MSHTPAPWKVRFLESDKTQYFVEGPAPKGRAYATEIIGDDAYPEKLSDAYLVAAAPELLGACKALVAGQFTNDIARQNRLREMALKVIKKAETGET